MAGFAKWGQLWADVYQTLTASRPAPPPPGQTQRPRGHLSFYSGRRGPPLWLTGPQGGRPSAPAPVSSAVSLPARRSNPPGLVGGAGGLQPHQGSPAHAVPPTPPAESAGPVKNENLFKSLEGFQDRTALSQAWGPSECGSRVTARVTGHTDPQTPHLSWGRKPALS